MKYGVKEELLPLLRQSNDARIINLSSAAQASVSADILKGKRAGDVSGTYAQSKLALTIWSFYLASKEDSISIIPVNPGSLQNTKMVQEAYGMSWSSPDKGATILTDLATSTDYYGITGKYFDNDRGVFAKAHPDAYDENKIGKLVELTSEILGKYVS